MPDHLIFSRPPLWLSLFSLDKLRAHSRRRKKERSENECHSAQIYKLSTSGLFGGGGKLADGLSAGGWRGKRAACLWRSALTLFNPWTETTNCWSACFNDSVISFWQLSLGQHTREYTHTHTHQMVGSSVYQQTCCGTMIKDLTVKDFQMDLSGFTLFLDHDAGVNYLFDILRNCVLFGSTFSL